MNKNIMQLSREERLEAIKQRFYESLPADKRERHVISKTEARVANRENDDQREIEGYAAVFDKTTSIRWFTESIDPHAFDETIEKDEIVACFNHDPNLVLGRNSAGTMLLSTDNIGLKYLIYPPDTQAGNDVHTSITRGDVKGSSFWFIVLEDKWSYADDSDDVHRTILKVRLIELGPVTFPAYVDTTASARSLGDWLEAQINEAQQAADDKWKRDAMRRRLDLAALE